MKKKYLSKENLSSGVYLIKIIKPLAYMPLEKYTQEASYSAKTKKFYVNKGVAGGRSIGLQSVEIIKLLTKFKD